MAIWLALLIPVLTAVVLHFGFRRQIVWWELVVPFGVCLLLVSVSKGLIEYCQTQDTEYWTTYVERAEYWEDWSELVVKTRTVSDGKNTRTETYTEIEYHPPKWYVVDPTGQQYSVSSAHFESLCGRFGQRQFHPVHRFGAIVKSGGKYLSHWPKTDATMEVLTVEHSYENRVQAAPTVFGHRKIDKQEKEQYGLYDYPPVEGLRQKMVLGVEDASAERTLNLWNAKYGSTYQIRMWLLVYHNQPLDAAFAQESYWQGGNKNELILCVGVDGSGSVQWGYVLSWTERETFKAEVRTLIEQQIGKPLQPTMLVNRTAELVPNGWQRKHFKDFSYLSVEPPLWSVVFTYCLTLLACGVCGWWAVTNEHTATTTGDLGPAVIGLLIGVCALLLILFVGLKIGGVMQ